MADFVNLDYVSAEMATRLVDNYSNASVSVKKDAKNHIQKSMGVLQEDGLYAFSLYQVYRKDKGGEILERLVSELLLDSRVSSLFFSPPPTSHESKSGPALMMDLTGKSIDRIFMARDLIMRLLVYAYYHFRSIKEGEGR